MSRLRRQILLAVTALVMLAMLLACAAMPANLRDPNRPSEVGELTRWLADHPADWQAASALSMRALDADAPNRRQLWQRSHAHAQRLAPGRLNGPTSFVRGGLFHWYELGEADRAEILEVAAPMLRDPTFFTNMHKPLWELTRDLDYLRRNAPATDDAIVRLREIAVMNGLFADYRALRDALARQRLAEFEAERDRLTAVELIRLLPSPLTREDEPLVRGVLDQLQRRPLDASSAVSVHERGADLADFAIRNNLRPLEGLEVLVETREVPVATRARLAAALGRTKDARAIAAVEPRQTASTQWEGTCGRDVCYSALATIAADRAITIDVAVVQNDEVPPYVEIYVDDERAAEGPVEDTRRFMMPVRSPGQHRVEVRLANPLTRNRIQRRIRLS
jgi:hypothetical protein